MSGWGELSRGCRDQVSLGSSPRIPGTALALAEPIFLTDSKKGKNQLIYIHTYV